MAYLSFCDVTKVYKMGDVLVQALNGVTFSVEKGEFCVIVGPSGAGKSTVLNLLGGMDSATSGVICFNGSMVSAYSERELMLYRRHDIGFVFQFYNLIQNLTAQENVELAVQLCSDARNVDEVLNDVGLVHRKYNFPAQLSGGEQQRVSIARALAKNPKLLLCDEPTGALDVQTGKTVLNLLHTYCKTSGCTVIVVTHNASFCDIADRVIHIKNGLCERMQVNDQPISVDELEW